MENKKIKVYMAESKEELNEQLKNIYEAEDCGELHVIDTYTDELKGVWVAVLVYVQVSPFYVEL